MPSSSEPSQPEPAPLWTTSPRPAQVRWYSLAKGYGFARLTDADGNPDPDERDIFLHHSLLPQGEVLAEGEPILIEIAERERGPYATRLERRTA